MFQINAEALPLSEALPYLLWTIKYNNINWEEVYQNLQKARRWGGMIVRVLVKTGALLQAQRMIYKSVYQSVLQYESEIWVLTGGMLKVLEVFHHQEARQITGMVATCGSGR